MSKTIDEKTLNNVSVEEPKKNTKQKIELEILKGIRYAEEDIVIAVEKALDVGDYPKDKNGTSKLEDSQFRNLVRVAETTESPEVVKNFLRYQVGRDGKWGRGEKSLAEHIVRDIDGKLKTYASKIAEKADSNDTRRIHMDLIRRYLGYGARRLKYLNPEKERVS